MKTRWRLLTVVGLFLVTGVWLSLSVRQSRMPRLLERARYVMSVQNSAPLIWLDNHRLLMLEQLPNSPREAYVLDTSTGQRQSHAALNRAMRRLGDGLRFSFSPDKEWALITQISWSPKTRSYSRKPWQHFLASLRTGEITPYPSGNYFVLGWLSNHQGWVTSSGIKNDRRRRLFQRGSQKTQWLPPANPIPGVYLGMDGQNGLIQAHWEPYQTTQLNLFTVDLLTDSVRHSQSVPVPPNNDVSYVGMSSDARQLLWHTRDAAIPSPISGILSVLERWIPQSSELDRDYLWVSDLNGKRMRALGWAEVKRQYDYDSDLYPSAWLPDGKQVSFFYRDALWTIPVEK